MPSIETPAMNLPSTLQRGWLAFLTGILVIGSSFIVSAETAKPNENLLRNTRLVAGLPSGWVLMNRVVPTFSEGDDFVARTDETVKGPSGYPAFLVNVLSQQGVAGSYGVERELFFCTEPFCVPEDGEFTASVYVRGSGKGALEVIGNGALKKAKAEFSVAEKNGWQRITCRFKGTKAERLYSLWFRLNGKFWFDAFQVNAGSEATAYGSQLPAEVALTPARGDASQVRTHFDDEPALMEWTVTGASPGDRLRGRVVDLDNQTADLSDVSLDGSTLQKGSWNYAMPSLNSLGQFRVETWIEDAKGQRRSAFNEMVVTRLRRPHFWGKDAPDSPFGVHAQPTSSQILAAKAAGFNWVRLHDTGIQALGWFYVEPKPGEWKFHDDKIDRYRNQKLLILGELGTAPHFRSRAKNAGVELPPIEATKTTAFFAPENPDEYSDYVRRAVQHYGDKIGHYDIWNEPWHPSFFHVDYVTKRPETLDRASDVGTGGKGWYLNAESAPEDYARLQKAAFDPIRKINPKTQVVGMGTHTHKGKEGRISGDIWSQRMATAGGMETLDIVGYHQYNTSGAIGPENDSLNKEIQWTFAPLGGVAGIEKSGHPVWMTEGSPIVKKTFSGFYHYSLPYRDTENYRENSDRIARFMVRLLCEGIDREFLYSMDAWSGFGQPGRARVFVNEDGFPHPTAAAAANVTWHLENTKFRRAFKLAGESGTAYVFDGQKSTTAVLIPNPGTSISLPNLTVPAIEMEDLFGNPPDGEKTETLLFLRGTSPEMTVLLKDLET